MADELSTWDKWRRNGRLATVGLVLMFFLWFYFQRFVPPTERPGELDKALWAMLGLWVANIAYGKQKTDEERASSIERRVDAAEERAENAEAKVDRQIEKAKGETESD